MDITFWSLDFEEKTILPASSPNGGYISMNATIQFNGNGGFELIFNSNKIRKFAKAHPEGYFIVWGDFQGYATDHQFGGQSRIFGNHLNAILHKAVIPVYTATGEISSVLQGVLGKYAPWLTMVETSIADTSEYQSDTYLSGDVFVQNYLEAAGLGYVVYIQDRKLFLELIKPQTTELVLDENNLNVYEIQEDFSNKKVAYGGWYKETQSDDGTKLDTETWKYICTSEKDGVYKQDVVLNANSPAKAMQELKQHIIERNTICKTCKVEYIKNYHLGDVVTLQSDDYTSKKQITSVDLWYEGASYHTEPTLSEWEA